jgi:glycosyltransferase involved in cell wall biosynthesis
MNELISVVIPCFNHAKYLPDALKSILDQTYQAWECFIVNDGSPDDTECIAKEWCLKDSRFKYLYKNNGGLSSARNFGIQNATGKYILTLDADDKFETTFMEKALKILLANHNIGMVCSWGHRFIGKKKGELFIPIGATIKEFLFFNAANMGSLLFRKECWEKVNGYDEKMKLGYEDWEFYIRVCKLGWRMDVIQEPLFFYRQHAISMRTVAVSNHDINIKKYIYHKHKELYKEYFDDLIAHFLISIDLEKKNNINIKKRIDYRLGTILLKPLLKLF